MTFAFVSYWSVETCHRGLVGPGVSMTGKHFEVHGAGLVHLTGLYVGHSLDTNSNPQPDSAGLIGGLHSDKQTESGHQTFFSLPRGEHAAFLYMHEAVEMSPDFKCKLSPDSLLTIPSLTPLLVAGDIVIVVSVSQLRDKRRAKELLSLRKWRRQL